MNKVLDQMELSTIPAEWLESGDGETRSRVLYKSKDHLAWVVVWQCKAARFKWRYFKEEFAIFVDGEAFLTDPHGRQRHVEPGDFIYFHANSEATWNVPKYIRKIAILRSPVSWPLAMVVRAWNRFCGGIR
jgi:uncharacterized cupin superfamily protein